MELEELNKDLAKEEHVQDPEEVKVKSKKSYHPDGMTQVIGEVGCWQVGKRMMKELLDSQLDHYLYRSCVC